MSTATIGSMKAAQMLGLSTKSDVSANVLTLLAARGVEPVAQVPWGRGIARSYNRAQVRAIARALKAEAAPAVVDPAPAPQPEDFVLSTLYKLDARLTGIETALNVLLRELGAPAASSTGH